MKSNILIALFLLLAGSVFAQNPDPEAGKLYLYWGWNRSWYIPSDIRFSGEDYNFVLHDVIADDRQDEFNLRTYFHPALFTIPQYNFRIGYTLNAHHDLSLGLDHMKYVVRQAQYVPISGEIRSGSSPYTGVYENEEIMIKPGFLEFEHTDGLNYLNLEWRWRDRLMNRGIMDLNFTGGIGLGMMLPKTNATLLGNDRHDDHHLAGFGFAPVVGLNVTFWDLVFVQTEFKAGWITMPDVRTTNRPEDLARQNFRFTQLNVVFGTMLRFRRQDK